MCFSINLSRFSSISLLVLRFAVAAAFLYHGMQKWVFWQGTPDGMPAAMLALMRFLAVVEPLAAVALILGLMTRFAALGTLCVMISAMTMKITSGMDFSKWELDMLLFAASLTLVLQGSGGLSLDILRRRR